MMKKEKKVFLALPVLNESNALPKLIECLEKQAYTHFELVVCVNNYNLWWDDPEKVDHCFDNEKSIKFLRTINEIEAKVIDKSSPGLGWAVKKGGVGWARKIAMDYINSVANEKDLIVSIDADTYYPPDYLHKVVEAFDENPFLDGISIPYYHKLQNDETDRLILRYEIYMRYYLINLIRINNPYAFTALGSAMACTIKSYRKTGGLTPVKSGEDFYFLQKLVKVGQLGIWADTMAYPSARLSDRVDFGTGPALIKGQKGDWNSYPIYQYNSFDQVGRTFNLFRSLFYKDVSTPMDTFFTNIFNEEKFWIALRNNYTDEKNFVKACVRKVDGLRILQFLKYLHSDINKTDEENLISFLTHFYSDSQTLEFLNNNPVLSFETTPVQILLDLRDLLFKKEMELRDKTSKLTK